MHPVKLFLFKCFINLVAFVYGFGFCVYLLYKFILDPKMKFLKVEKRERPLCLSDPALGVHKFAQLKDIKLHYVERGDPSKPLMLFLHGFPEFWYSWRYQMKEFSSDYWTVSVDLRGYGDSDKPESLESYETPVILNDIKMLVKFLGRDKFIMVAHDWGGILAWNFLDFYPNMISKYIIMGAPFPETWVPLMARHPSQFIKSWYCFFFQTRYLPEIAMSMNDLRKFESGVNHENPVGSQNITAKDLEAFKYTFGKPNALKYPINYYRANSGVLNWKDTHPEVFPPGLLIWGEKDLYLSKKFMTLSQKCVNNLKVVLVANGNHFVQQDQPIVVNNVMKTFLCEET